MSFDRRYDDDGEWHSEGAHFSHDLQIDLTINLKGIPDAMVERLFSNRITLNLDWTVQEMHRAWLSEVCSHPYVVGKNYIMFSDPGDRTLFLLKQE